MIIYGKPIADKIYKDLRIRTQKLKSKNVTPTLAIINITSDLASNIYVSEKRKAAEKLGIKIIIERTGLPGNQLLKFIEQLNSDKNIHGIIIQLPLPLNYDEEKIINSVVSNKDVDGFKQNSTFSNPVAQSVIAILNEVNKRIGGSNLTDRLVKKNISIIGKGRTAGKPIIENMLEMGIKVNLIDTRTKNSQNLIKNSDIVISCVGKKNILTSNIIKDGAIIIGVGMHTENGKLKADYEINKLKDKVSYITPVPLGIGPVNVAYLLRNVIHACETQSVKES